ncbi:MAG TPA: CAP domain-containing protein [Blastocatellia bacterium]|nr:CAP domain-containing protein [Blastocatellia bacterium]
MKRSVLCCTVISLIALLPCTITEAIQREDAAPFDLDDIRARLLKLVNVERAIAGVRPLVLDQLANRVAQEHAADMANGGFLSHWGRDGRKPYQRYSFAGGTDAVAENVSGLSGLRNFSVEDTANDLVFMHVRMHEESAPADGHRRTILAPHHTYVGFGVARVGDRLRLAEEYLARYVELAPVPRSARRLATVTVSGKLLNPAHKLHSVDVYFEPPPLPMDLAWLQTPRSYALPDTLVTLRLRLPSNVVYADGSTGTIQMERGGKFRFPVRLFNDSSGVYTIVMWVSDSTARKAFPATNICIQAE